MWTEDGESRPAATSHPVRAAPATLRPSIAEWRQKRSGGEERDKMMRGGAEFLVDGNGEAKG